MKHIKLFFIAVLLVLTLTFLASCGCSIYPPDAGGGTTAHVHTEVVDPPVPPTCTTTGLTEGKHCSVCGEVLVAQDTVAAMGHSAEVIPAVPATCTATGLSEGSKCSVCGEVLTAQTVVEKTGHTEEVLPAVAATCTEIGLTEGKRCSVCGEVLVAQTEKRALGHYIIRDEAVPATPDAEGLTEGQHCKDCGAILVEQRIVPKLKPKDNASYPYAELISRTTDENGWTTVQYYIWEGATERYELGYSFKDEGIGCSFLNTFGNDFSRIYVPFKNLSNSDYEIILEFYRDGKYTGDQDNKLAQYTTSAGFGYTIPGSRAYSGDVTPTVGKYMPRQLSTGKFELRIHLVKRGSRAVDGALNLKILMTVKDSASIYVCDCNTFDEWQAYYLEHEVVD